MVSDTHIAVLLGVSVLVFFLTGLVPAGSLVAGPADLLRRGSFLTMLGSGGYLAATYLLNPGGGR